MTGDTQVLLYDLENYGGAGRAPGYRPGDVRFFLNAYSRQPGAPFASLIWTASATTYDEALTLVPSGGRRFDRTGNFPSPMVPVEGWRYDGHVGPKNGPKETVPG